MSPRLTRLAPLTGVLFVIVTLAAFISGGETPSADASPLKVIAYYAAHKSTIERSAVLFVFAFLFALFWAGALASYLREQGAASGLSGLIVGGGVLMAAGAGILGGTEYGLAHNLHVVGAQTAQTLNILDNELFLPVVIGGCVFGIASGLAILSTRSLPAWLGWVALVIGIAAAIPPISFPALLAFVVWTLVVSIMIFLRADRDDTAAAPPPVVAEPGAA